MAPCCSGQNKGDTKMTRRTAPRQSDLTRAAKVANATGAVIVIEVLGGDTYRIAPAGDTLPLGRGEREAAECDKAFGVTR